jgi:hypothetical protein
MGISVELNQGYRGIKLALSNTDEAKRVMDFLLPYMNQGLEINVNIVPDEKEKNEEKEEETDGE